MYFGGWEKKTDFKYFKEKYIFFPLEKCLSLEYVNYNKSLFMCGHIKFFLNKLLFVCKSL